MAKHVLVVDDNRTILKTFDLFLSSKGLDVVSTPKGSDVLELLENHPIDLVLLDLFLEDDDGLSVMARMRAGGFDTPVIMISGDGSISSAVKAVNNGALDFLEKPISNERLWVTVQNALRLSSLEPVVTSSAEDNLGLIGVSTTATELRQVIRTAAPTGGRILITGENGTGKELVAQAIHRLSNRSTGPLVSVNCAAIPPTLIESELFGHEKGAFTGAMRTRKGKFETADGGTLFLDEVGEMSLEAQAKFLRVLQQSEIERVGGTVPITVDVRVVAATNRDLWEMVEQGQFREDLYYRLNVIPINIPALRDHRDDIPVLAKAFSDHFQATGLYAKKEFTPDALQALMQHDYPGNVRELQNIVERLAILSPGHRIQKENVRSVLPSRSSQRVKGLYQHGSTWREMLFEAQREIIESALKANNKNVTQTARMLGVERSHIYKKCRQLGLAISRGGDAKPDLKLVS